MRARFLGVICLSFSQACTNAVGSGGTDPLDSGAVADLGPDAGRTDAGGDGGVTDTGVGSPDLGASDSGAPDSGTSDTGGTVDAGPQVGCAGAPYKLCEDFEGTADSQVPTGWRRAMPYNPNANAADPAEVLVTSDQPHHGTKSLKSTSDECAQTRIEYDLASLGATASRHWGRVYFYVQTPAPQSNQNGGWYHTTMVALRGDNSGGGSAKECRVVDMVENAFDQSVAFLYNVPDDSCCDSTEVNPYSFEYESVWHCAEWFVEASTNSYRFFLDGTELLSFSNNNGARLPECNYSVAVGALCYAPPLNAPQNFTAWIDDFAIDDNRIGCN